MLHRQLDQAGFFAIQWAPAAAGTMYVRPSAHGVQRVFVPAGTQEVELYASQLFWALRYQCAPRHAEVACAA